MIDSLVDIALHNRFIVLGVALALFVWGAIAFKELPVEAYPDVANTWVQVITQWPGRAAEEVEQQVTIPIEIQMNGIPHLAHVRSASLAGLSVVNLIFDDESDNDWDRQKVLERISMVTLPPNLSAQIGPDFSPIGSIYWYTLSSSNPCRGDGGCISIRVPLAVMATGEAKCRAHHCEKSWKNARMSMHESSTPGNGSFQFANRF